MKKILVLLLTTIVLFTALPTVSVCAEKVPTFAVSSQKAKAGDTVNITVSVKNNPGIISMKLSVKYDSDALELLDCKEGKFKGVAFSPNQAKPFIINWIDAIHPNNKSNGTVATLSFKVLDTAPQGKSEISLSYDPENVFEMTNKNDFVNVTFATQSGYVDITNSNPVTNESSSSQTGSNATASNTESKPSHTHSESEVQDTTGSQILEQFINSSSTQQTDNETIKNDTSSSEPIASDNANSQNDWLLWIVIAAAVVLVGAITLVIIKSKKEK